MARMTVPRGLHEILLGTTLEVHAEVLELLRTASACQLAASPWVVIRIKAARRGGRVVPASRS